MTDLYLIAHKVHGQPAFDIAMRFDAKPSRYDNQGRVRSYIHVFDTIPTDFDLANGAEEDPFPWWIIPTSGRRAYPWCWAIHLCHYDGSISFNFPPGFPGPMPSNLPDHYPQAPAIDLATALGLTKSSSPSPSSKPFPRRL